ncbi:FMRFamide receptor-like [Lineus longissimus]|uniref:FMRFamide receptor-like n=1 Tax=Lineus longissimus TaxID=88925 RepID=UPI00315C91EB
MTSLTSAGYEQGFGNYTMLGMADTDTTVTPVVFSEYDGGTNPGDLTTTGIPKPQGNPTARARFIEFVVVGIIQTIFCCIGLILNTLSSIVWWREGARNVTIYLLRILSLVDNCFLLIVLLYHSIPVIFNYFQILPDHFKALMAAIPYTWPLLWTTKTLAVWCIVVMSIVRYNIVCKPLNTSVRFSMRRVTQYLVGLFLVLILWNVPRWFEIKILKVTITTNVTLTNETQLNETQFKEMQTNYTIERPEWTDMANDAVYQIVYHSILTIFIIYALPMTIILYCSIRLIRILREADMYRKKLVVNSVQISHNVTKMLLTVIVLFVICETPEFINSMLYLIVTVDPNGALSALEKSEPHHFEILRAFSDLAFTVNSSVNFFIYYLMARKFRKLVKEVICCEPKNNPRRTTSFTTQRTMSVSCNSSVGSFSIAAESPMPPRNTGHSSTQSSTEQVTKLGNDNSDGNDERQYKGTNQLTIPKASQPKMSLTAGNGDVLPRPPLTRNHTIDETEMGVLINENYTNVEVEMNTNSLSE